MIKVANMNEVDRRVLFMNTAEKMSMHPSIVEKDFWVCYILDYLFHRCEWQKAFVFKGGTSLSKAYHVIDRFSEDIDLILNWNQIGYVTEEVWEEKSKTKQDRLNKQMIRDTAVFLRDKFIPTVNSDIRSEIEAPFEMDIDVQDEQTVNFMYPHIFTESHITYIRPEIRLEIGPLAEWEPHHEEKVESYAAEHYSQFFDQKSTMIRTLDAERTFWEKATILHKVAYRDITNPFPQRYARHYYDLYCMHNSRIKESAFDKKELLKQDIAFKKKFYMSNHSGYETAEIGTFKLCPQEGDVQALSIDYEQMKGMFFGEIPEFSDLMQGITKLEQEINGL